jgi:hypothetical protein
VAQEEVGSNPTDRGKNGSKRRLIVDGRGILLSLDVTGANVHDVKIIAFMVYGTVIKCPETEQNLCLDNGYRGERDRRIIEDADYVSHVQGRSAERADKANNPEYKACQWEWKRHFHGSTVSGNSWFVLKTGLHA